MILGIQKVLTKIKIWAGFACRYCGGKTVTFTYGKPALCLKCGKRQGVSAL